MDLKLRKLDKENQKLLEAWSGYAIELMKYELKSIWIAFRSITELKKKLQEAKDIDDAKQIFLIHMGVFLARRYSSADTLDKKVTEIKKCLGVTSLNSLAAKTKPKTKEKEDKYKDLFSKIKKGNMPEA